MPESQEALLARVDENVEHLRSEFDRFREELPDLVKRISALERHRAWLIGFVAAVGALLGRKEFIALLAGLLLAGCAQAPIIKSPVVMTARPVRVLIDPKLPACEIEATMLAVDFWREQGVPVDLDVWDPDQAARRGDVSVVDFDIPKEGIVGLTVTLELVIEVGRPEIWAAIVFLDSCLPQVAAHELGHALGLKHRQDEGALMYPSAAGGGWGLTDQELSWIQ